MTAVNNTTIAYVFSEAIQTLWPDAVKFDVLLLPTDASIKHKKNSQRTSVCYHKLIYAIFAAHILHSICQTICVFYPNEVKLVSKRKKISDKSSARIELFQNNATDTSLPPTPVITHLET